MKKSFFQKTVLATLLLSPMIVFAQPEAPTLKEPGTAFGKLLKYTGNKAGYETDVEEGFLVPLLGNLALALISLLGVFFISLVIYGGYRWMFARGNEQEVTAAMNIIKQAFIGLIVVLGSYGIWKVVEAFI